MPPVPTPFLSVGEPIERSSRFWRRQLVKIRGVGGLVGVAKSRIPLFPTLTNAAAVRKGGISSMPALTPAEKNPRKTRFVPSSSKLSAICPNPRPFAAMFPFRRAGPPRRAQRCLSGCPGFQQCFARIGQVLAAEEVHYGRTENGCRANGRPALSRAGDETARHCVPKSPSGCTAEDTRSPFTVRGHSQPSRQARLNSRSGRRRRLNLLRGSPING
jgi:hypothetical protein